MDPYVYPGTDVLRNLRDLRDSEELSRFEMDMTTRRLAELKDKHNPAGKFDSRHLQAIHRAIFQDVYPWAGQFRTVNIARPGQFYFAFAEQIVPTLHNTFEVLRDEGHLQGLAAEGFARRAAHYLGELNAIHPFRDGNGRTQREFIRQLAARAGHLLEWRLVTRAAIYEASQRSFQRGDSTGLAEVIAQALAAAAGA